MPKPLVDLIKSKNELSKTIHSNYEEACPDTRRADEVRLIGLKQEISNSLAGGCPGAGGGVSLGPGAGESPG